jgi:hypothetical protein
MSNYKVKSGYPLDDIYNQAINQRLSVAIHNYILFDKEDQKDSTLKRMQEYSKYSNNDTIDFKAIVLKIIKNNSEGPITPLIDALKKY